jgi:crossover junction endodeoxyribonuclease RuvC
MRVIMGIDPGIATTGFGLVKESDGGSLEALTFGVILTPPDMPAHQRLSLLYHDLNDLFLLHRPDGVAVEKLFFQTNVKTAIAVGQARGVVLLAISEAGLSLSEYTPNEVKQAVVGYGSAGKKQVQEMVKVLLALDEIPKPDDAADALAIAITDLSTHKYL